MKILGLSGSLRSVSINSALLRAATRLVPSYITMSFFDGLGELPLFNPDLEQSPQNIVTSFRSQVADADALLIASPEYAHGITGTMKNALDWLVSFEPVPQSRSLFSMHHLVLITRTPPYAKYCELWRW